MKEATGLVRDRCDNINRCRAVLRVLPGNTVALPVSTCKNITPVLDGSAMKCQALGLVIVKSVEVGFRLSMPSWSSGCTSGFLPTYDVVGQTYDVV